MPLNRRPWKSPPISALVGFAAPQHNVWFRVGKTNRRIELMAGTALLVTLAALVAVKCATRVGVDASHFDGLPWPSRLD
jgi:hypothetical protein